MSWSPLLARTFADSYLESITLGHPVVDEYLAFAGARLRLNSWLAVAFDLKVFFSIIGKEPVAVTTADVFAFIKTQRASRLGPKVVRLEDGESGLSTRTIKRRLASVSGLFAYLESAAMRVCITTLSLGDALLPRYALIGTEPWWKRCCSAGCAAARYSVCA